MWLLGLRIATVFWEDEGNFKNLGLTGGGASPGEGFENAYHHLTSSGEGFENA